MFRSLLEVNGNQIGTFVVLGVLVVAIIVMFVFSGRRRKKQEEEAKTQRDAVRPGNKVKTIGGICGIVVEVDQEENTFVLETGSENAGKSFIKFDKLAIWQTDAVADSSAKTEEKPEADNKPEEVKEEAPAALPAELPAEEKPAATEEKSVTETEKTAPASKNGKKNK